MSEEIVLFDLLGRGDPRCWSLNVWKTRLALNYKDIPYKTIWLPFTRIRQTLEPLVPPNEPGSWTSYSVPAILMPSTEQCIMDSTKIAAQLELLKPEPSLHLDPKFDEEILQAVNTLIFSLAPVFFAVIQRDMVVQEDTEWHAKDRAERFGMSVFDLERAMGGEPAWQAAQPAIEKLKTLMRERRGSSHEGPFVLGGQVSYADFLIVAALAIFHTLGEKSWARILEAGGPEFRALWEAARPWTEKDN